MKHIKRKLLIALAILLLIPIGGIAALFTIREPPDGPRVAVEPGIVGVEAGGAYAWIVRTATGAVLIDAGLDAKGTAILAELTSVGLTADSVRAVLITHGHPDHYAAATLFAKAQIFAGADDLAMIRGDHTHYATFGKVMGAILPLPPAPSAMTGLHGEEQLHLDGARFSVIATPGHSPGSVMYLYKDVLFTGDSLMRKNGGVAIVPSLFSENAAQNLASLQKLDAVVFERIADGHAGVTNGAKAKLSDLLRPAR